MNGKTVDRSGFQGSVGFFAREIPPPILGEGGIGLRIGRPRTLLCHAGAAELVSEWVRRAQTNTDRGDRGNAPGAVPRTRRE